MPKFYLPAEEIGETITLTGENAHHLSRSLRARVGEEVSISDGVAHDYIYKVTDFTKESVLLARTEALQGTAETRREVTLFIAAAKGDKTETMIQKATECGARRIVPFISENCIARPEKGRRLERWQKVALEAASQSGRTVPPEVLDVVSFKEALAMTRGQKAAFLYEKAKTPLKNWVEELSEEDMAVSFFIGSEGGFSAGEAAMAKQAQLGILTLGPRILRCETVPAFILGAFLALTGEI